MTTQKIKSILNVFGIKPETVLQAFEKVAPKYAPFLSKAAAIGHAPSEILGFLKNKFSGKGDREAADNEQLERRIASGNARPDEKASSSLYNQRSEGREIGRGALSALGGIGAAAAGGAAIPLAAQGISSLIGQGDNTQQAQPIPQAQPQSQPNPLTQQVASPPHSQPTATTKPTHNPASSFITQFPELAKYIESEIDKGASPQEAASTAKARKLLRPIIDKIENQVGEKFEDLIGRLYPSSAKKASSKGGEEDLGASLKELINMIRGK